MRIGVLGTGMVGSAIGTRLVELGHSVCMGARDAHNTSALAWASSVGSLASNGTFADAAAHGELVFNCTSGAHTLDALAAAGEDNLAGKALIDVTNPLVWNDGVPSLSVANTDSLGEQVQRAHPRSRVVKALNTMNAGVMVRPAELGSEHAVFYCGDDAAAKSELVALLSEMGWTQGQLVDLGDLAAARGTEAYLLFWLRVMSTLGTPVFNVALTRN